MKFVFLTKYIPFCLIFTELWLLFKLSLKTTYTDTQKHTHKILISTNQLLLWRALNHYTVLIGDQFSSCSAIENIPCIAIFKMLHEYNGMPNYGKQKQMVGEGAPQTPVFFSKLFIEVINNTLHLYYCSCQC